VRAGSRKGILTPRWATSATLLVLGASGIAAQTLLLRELLVLSGGNEFSLGITLGGWLLTGAVGAVLAGRGHRLPLESPAPYIAVSLLFSALLPLALFLARSWKTVAGISPDLGVGLIQVTLASLAVLALPAALHGWLFVAGCALAGRASGQPATAAGSGYLLVSLGSLVGGLLTAFLLIPYSPPFSAATLIGILNLLAAIGLWQTMADRSSRAIPLLMGMAVVAATTMLVGGAQWCEHASLARQWQGKELVATVNSPYQQLAVIRSGEQLTLFSDGTLLFPMPDPDITRVEERAHFPLLAHPAPRRVLVLGGGAGGLIAEILKHPTVERVDYVEPDPWLLRLVARHAASGTARQLAAPRVRLHETDARRFVQLSRESYDVILLGAPLPLTLQGNRLFTTEFFAAAQQRLTVDGLLAIPASGSLTYYGPELGRVNATLLFTLRSVFPAVTTIPGDENLFLAGSRPPNLDPVQLGSRLRQRGLTLQLVTPEHLAGRLEAASQSWFSRTIGPLPVELNRDRSPRLLLWHLGYGSSQFDPLTGRLLNRLGGLGLVPMLTGTAVAALFLALAGWHRRRGVLGAIAVTGFGGMLLELVLIMAWQILQGAMYQALALLITAFMVGLALGSWLANGRLERGDDARRLFLRGEAGMVLAALLVAAVPALLSRAAALPTALSAGLLLLLALVGVLVGGQFPLAVCLAEQGDRTTHSATGAVYGADLLGACLGGMVGGALLLPALGMIPACLVVVILKLGSWCGVARVRST